MQLVQVNTLLSKVAALISRNFKDVPAEGRNQRIIRIPACRCVEDAAAKQRSPTPAQVHIAEGSARIGDAQPAIPPPIRHALLMGAKAPVEISDSHDAMRTMAESGAGCSSHRPQHNQQAPAHLVCIPLSFEA
jgi:hypothetical protein